MTFPTFPGRQSTTFSRARSFAGLTQAELAAAVTASRETICAIEHGRRIPSVTLAIAIARRLDIDVETLFAHD